MRCKGSEGKSQPLLLIDSLKHLLEGRPLQFHLYLVLSIESEDSKSAGHAPLLSHDASVIHHPPELPLFLGVPLHGPYSLGREALSQEILRELTQNLILSSSVFVCPQLRKRVLPVAIP
jgi:hypothetical protein